MLKLRDADTGESQMDVVEVPEGLSLQLGNINQDYISLILDRQGEDELFNFLLRRRESGKPTDRLYHAAKIISKVGHDLSESYIAGSRNDLRVAAQVCKDISTMTFNIRDRL